MGGVESVEYEAVQRMIERGLYQRGATQEDLRCLDEQKGSRAV